MIEILCMYCGNVIFDGVDMYLAKEPHRAPRPAHENCGVRAVEQSRGRTTLTPKRVERGIILDRLDSIDRHLPK